MNRLPFNCKLCSKLYAPGPNEWIFHDLCDRCFPAFDTQKWAGRIHDLRCYFEDSDEWVDAKQKLANKRVKLNFVTNISLIIKSNN